MRRHLGRSSHWHRSLSSARETRQRSETFYQRSSTFRCEGDLVREFLEDRRHHLAVAVDQGHVVGFASAVHYIHPDKDAELWINEVGVAPGHRRGGLGKELLRALFRLGRDLGCREAWVLTERDGHVLVRPRSGRGRAKAREGQETIHPHKGCEMTDLRYPIGPFKDHARDRTTAVEQADLMDEIAAAPARLRASRGGTR